MKNLVFYFLFHYGVMFILNKHNIHGLLHNWSTSLSKVKFLSKLIYNITECSLCLSHHVGLLIITPLFFMFELDYIYFIYPLMSASIMNIIQKLSNE